MLRRLASVVLRLWSEWKWKAAAARLALSGSEYQLLVEPELAEAGVAAGFAAEAPEVGDVPVVSVELAA